MKNESPNLNDAANSDLGAISVSAYCESCGITTATEGEDLVCLQCGSYGYCSMNGCKAKVQKLLLCDGCGKIV